MQRHLCLAFLAACATATAAEQNDCKTLFARQLECTNSFVPSLVDTRMRLDKPAGISTANRAELIVIAQQEWAEDSKPAAVEKTCQRKLPDAVVTEMKACLQKQTCEQFVGCLAPVLEKTL